jgi:hypothetical protein
MSRLAGAAHPELWPGDPVVSAKLLELPDADDP